ncbi:hypothetical protein PENSPDRAFT_695630 [Peniophora sp. CONT]|nr:hypothetical protein PENSPDRAFT_695630 [Peniophora sp. CONT]
MSFPAQAPLKENSVPTVNPAAAEQLASAAPSPLTIVQPVNELVGQIEPVIPAPLQSGGATAPAVSPVAPPPPRTSAPHSAAHSAAESLPSVLSEDDREVAVAEVTTTEAGEVEDKVPQDAPPPLGDDEDDAPPQKGDRKAEVQDGENGDEVGQDPKGKDKGGRGRGRGGRGRGGAARGGATAGGSAPEPAATARGGARGRVRATAPVPRVTRSNRKAE